MNTNHSILRDEKQLRLAASSSSSISECLQKLGLKTAGGNYTALKKWCNEYNITIPKATGYTHTRKALASKTKFLDEILIKNSSYSNRSQIKKRCYKSGLLTEECYSCHIGPNWNGRPLTLQLDHINGINNDHRIENLQILCPNCHTQTSTFAGRNCTTQA